MEERREVVNPPIVDCTDHMSQEEITRLLNNIKSFKFGEADHPESVDKMIKAAKRISPVSAIIKELTDDEYDQMLEVIKITKAELMAKRENKETTT